VGLRWGERGEFAARGVRGENAHSPHQPRVGTHQPRVGTGRNAGQGLGTRTPPGHLDKDRPRIQNTAYNQPPHPSFFIGNNMPTAPRPTVYTP
jgi:hypothetical protein